MATEPKILGTRLVGKVAIVTGGGSGFGESISKRFSEEGCKVVVADLDPVGGQRVASYHSKSMHFIKMDVAKEEDWENVIENTLNKFGRVDILVNNAGTSYRNKGSRSRNTQDKLLIYHLQPSLDVIEDEFDKVFNVNVRSIFHVSTPSCFHD
jgi:NAD(P)-dependent dehydrogenase (short-subunit alcohol dehydrogenase family)